MIHERLFSNRRGVGAKVTFEKYFDAREFQCCFVFLLFILKPLCFFSDNPFVVHTSGAHSAPVTCASLHPTGDYFVTCSLDKTWAFHDIETGICQQKVIGCFFAALIVISGSVMIFVCLLRDLDVSRRNWSVFDTRKNSLKRLGWHHISTCVVTSRLAKDKKRRMSKPAPHKQKARRTVKPAPGRKACNSV